MHHRLEYLANHYPRRAEVFYRLGESALASGRVDQAKAAWSRVPAGTAFSAQAALAQAQIALQEGQFSNAEKLLKEGLAETGPSAMGVRRLLLVILVQEGRNTEARRLIEDRLNEPGLSTSDLVALIHDHMVLTLTPCRSRKTSNSWAGPIPPGQMMSGSGSPAPIWP